jgi:triphosphoribosyl-dephospho-CoA synthetase
VDGRENEKAMQDATLEQQEKFLEKLIITYNKHEANKTFKNIFEQTQLADLIHRIRQQYIENKNWNESRKNPLVVAESNTFEVNLFESSGEKMIVNGQSQAMLQVL